MTEYTIRSLVIITPLALLPTINQVSEGLGYTAGFTVELTSDGENLTHLGLHATSRPHFLWILTGNPAEPTDDHLAANRVIYDQMSATVSEMMTPEELAYIRSQLIVSADMMRGNEMLFGSEHFDEVLAANGLSYLNNQQGTIQ